MINFESNEANKIDGQEDTSTVVQVHKTPVMTQNQQINTQVNTFNQMPLPRIPAMYFPHSNVTINYNFGK